MYIIISLFSEANSKFDIHSSYNEKVIFGIYTGILRSLVTSRFIRYFSFEALRYLQKYFL